MIPVYQTINGHNGNCWPAVIASILEIPQCNLHTVPHFCVLYPEAWQEETNKWLAQFGVWFVCLLVESVEGLPFKPRGFHGISGVTDRGTYHACVGYDGEIIHDPIMGGCGLRTIETYDLFVPYDPTLMLIKKGKE